jgi:hypothetical protein
VGITSPPTNILQNVKQQKSFYLGNVNGVKRLIGSRERGQYLSFRRRVRRFRGQGLGYRAGQLRLIYVPKR